MLNDPSSFSNPTTDIREEETATSCSSDPAGERLDSVATPELAKRAHSSDPDRLTARAVDGRGSKKKVLDARIVEARAMINKLVHTTELSGMAAACLVGNQVVNSFFGGDFAAATRQSGHKEVSLRKICGLITREDCVVRRSWLTEAVNLASLQHSLHERGVDGLGKGQAKALLMLDNVEDQVSWAQGSLQKGLGANELKRQIRAELKAAASTQESVGGQQTLDFDALSKMFDGFRKKLSLLVSNGTNGKIVDLETANSTKVEECLTKFDDLMAELGAIRSQVTPEATR